MVQRFLMHEADVAPEPPSSPALAESAREGEDCDWDPPSSPGSPAG